MNAPPLRWLIGMSCDSDSPETQTFVTQDDAPQERSPGDRRARRMHLASIGVLILALPVLVPAMLETPDGQRPYLPLSVSAAFLLCGLGVYLNKSGAQLRKRIGYRIPPSMKDVATAAHVADSIVREAFAGSFKARNAHRKVWGYLIYYLEELDRARVNQRPRRWCKCYDRTMELLIEINRAAVLLTGYSPSEADE